ncbi:MAG: TrmO family methyltransferase [Dialister invisus]
MWFYILPTKLTARPQKRRPGQRNLTVFASRSPHRPIPSIYAVKLVRRKTGFCNRADATDGNSIDIKPYVKELDEAEA